MIINFHQIKFSATKITQRWTGAKPSFAMIPGTKIINEPIACTKKYVTADVTSPTSNPVPTIRGITLTILISSQTQTMNQLLLIKTPIIEEISTNQYRGAKIELFLRLKTPTTGAGTSRLKIWLEAKFSLKAAPF